MTDHLERARSNAAISLFSYIYQIRHNRAPEQWEWAVGMALLNGELVAKRPPASSQLRTIHGVINDVALALDLPELLSDESDKKR